MWETNRYALYHTASNIAPPHTHTHTHTHTHRQRGQAVFKDLPSLPRSSFEAVRASEPLAVISEQWAAVPGALSPEHFSYPGVGTGGAGGGGIGAEGGGVVGGECPPHPCLLCPSGGP